MAHATSARYSTSSLLARRASRAKIRPGSGERCTRNKIGGVEPSAGKDVHARSEGHREHALHHEDFEIAVAVAQEHDGRGWPWLGHQPGHLVSDLDYHLHFDRGIERQRSDPDG